MQGSTSKKKYSTTKEMIREDWGKISASVKDFIANAESVMVSIRILEASLSKTKYPKNKSYKHHKYSSCAACCVRVRCHVVVNEKKFNDKK